MAKTMQDKALEAIREGRVSVVKASHVGIALDVVSSKPDRATMVRPTYRVIMYAREGIMRRQCNCPAVKRCYHLEAAEMLLWVPKPVAAVGERR